MSSNFKLKNNNSTELNIQHVDNAPAISLTSTDLSKISGLGTSSLTSTKIKAGIEKSNELVSFVSTTMPTSMTWKIGNFVENSAPIILGEVGLKYIINGWRRLTTGNSHVLNTDWVEVRSYTGS